jgi:hypothetical protein
MDGGYKMHWIDISIVIAGTIFLVKKRQSNEVGTHRHGLSELSVVSR